MFSIVVILVKAGGSSLGPSGPAIRCSIILAFPKGPYILLVWK